MVRARNPSVSDTGSGSAWILPLALEESTWHSSRVRYWDPHGSTSGSRSSSNKVWNTNAFLFYRSTLLLTTSSIIFSTTGTGAASYIHCEKNTQVPAEWQSKKGSKCYRNGRTAAIEVYLLFEHAVFVLGTYFHFSLVTAKFDMWFWQIGNVGKMFAALLIFNLIL